MTEVSRCIESAATDPYTNLAIEACLLRSVRDGGPILYLWQNERTVVIGRNQCASAECDLQKLERDGGHLARRRSGGGAVYHDVGNLNFTFVATKADYDQMAQTNVILDAVRSLGIDARRTGRNDLVTPGGRKFSGHASYHADKASLHHGTIMVGVDTEALGRYLTVDPQKLNAKGVRSVRSRVANLGDLRPDLTVDALKDALRRSFAQAVGGVVRDEDPRMLDADELERERERFASREWLFRGERFFEESRRARFAWGSVRVDLTCRDGVIQDLAVFSDALDTDTFDKVPSLLVGTQRTAEELAGRLRAGGLPEERAHDIACLVVG